YGRALELSADDDAALAQLLFRLGHALLAAGEDDAIDILERAFAALTESDDRESAAEVDILLAEARWMLGQRDRAFAHLSRARQLVGESGATPSRARVLAAYSRYQELAGQDETARPLAEEALALAESLGLKELQAHALNTLGLAKSHEGDPTWRADLERSIE